MRLCPNKNIVSTVIMNSKDTSTSVQKNALNRIEILTRELIHTESQ